MIQASVAATEVSCPHCDGKSREYVEVFGDTLRRCDRCRLVFLAPHPSTDQMVERHLSKEYADHPYFQAGEAAEADGGIHLHHELMSLLESRLEPGARLLDIGAGTGDFVKLASSRYEVEALEPSPYLAERIREKVGCPVHETSYENYTPDEPYDVVVLLDIIEHVSDPRALLARVHEYLRPGGLLFVSTLDSRSILYRLGPLFWRASRLSKKSQYILQRIFCYQHNWYFNRDVLREIVEEAEFEVDVQKGFEFPLNRLKESPVIVWGLRSVYLLNSLFGSPTEQFLLAHRGGAESR